MIYKNTAIRALSLIVALATSFFSYGDEDPASIQHRYMTPSMRVSTNAWLSVSGNVERIVSAATNGLATKAEVDAHVTDTNNPHSVTAGQVGALPLTGGTLTGRLSVLGKLDVGKAYEAIGELSVAGESGMDGIIKLRGGSGGTGGSATIGGGYGAGGSLRVEGGEYLGGSVSISGGNQSGGSLVVGDAGNGDENATASIKKGDKEVATEDYVDKTISATNPTFSNAVLAVGLNIDTNSVAVLNEIADTFGGFPVEGTATTVGGLLAALAAAIAWLRKNKVGSFASVGGASATVENGVAKLDDFFTKSNSLLTATIDARLPYPLYAVPSTGLLKDRAINTTSLASVTVPDNLTDLLIRASVASSLSVTMPEAISTKYGDTFPGEAGEYLITITKTGASEAYVRTIKLEEVANA